MPDVPERDDPIPWPELEIRVAILDAIADALAPLRGRRSTAGDARKVVDLLRKLRTMDASPEPAAWGPWPGEGPCGVGLTDKTQENRDG